MDIQALKLDLVTKILKTEKSSLLIQIEKLFEKENDQDWWDQLPDEVQQSILEGVENIKQREMYSHDQILREAKQKYGF
jgi:RNA polymerase-binding transcription factor DksA